MSQAARPSLTVAQLHTPLTNIPTLAHALTSGDRLDKVGIHQLLSGFAERSDGKTWDFTVSRKRARAKAEPSNDTDGDDDDVYEHEQVVDEEEQGPSAPTTPTTPITPTTRRAKRQRRGAARASPSFDERQDAGESAAAVTKARGKAKTKKVEAAEEGDKENDHNNNSSSDRNRAATSTTRSSRSRGRVAQKTSPRNSRRRKELKFDDEERPAAETEKEEKEQSGDAQDDQHEQSTTTTAAGVQAYGPSDEQHQGSYLASLHEAFAPASDRLSVLGDDGRYDPARLYQVPHPVGRRHSHSLIFPLLHSLEQQPQQHQHQHQHPYDDSLYDYNRYRHSHAAVAPTPTFANNTPLFAPPPTPPPPPAGPWYSMLMDHSIPAPPPPPAPLNIFQAASAASPQLTPSYARHNQHHYPPSPSMPLSSPEYAPQHYYTYGGERAPSPHTTLGGGDHPWAWLSEAGEEQILQFLRSTPAHSEPQPTLYPQQQRSVEMDMVAPSVEPGKPLLGFDSESEEARRTMARMRMSLARLHEAAVAAAAPMMASWTNNSPFASSFPPLVDRAASQLPRFSLASPSSSRSASPYHFRRASGGALPHFYGGGHCSMPSSASSSQPSSPYTVDMEIPYTTTLPSVDLSLSPSPLLLPVLHSTAAATTSMTTTRPRTPSSLLRSTTSRRRRSPTTGQAATSIATAQTPKRRKNAPKANDGR